MRLTKDTRLPGRGPLRNLALLFSATLCVATFCLMLHAMRADAFDIFAAGSTTILAAVVPGYVAGRTITPREIFYGSPPDSLHLKPGGVILDATYCQDGSNTGFTNEIRAGWALGKITASGQYRLCARSQANGAGSSSASLTVDNAAAFRAGDALQIGSTTGTISSVNYSTNVITLTATKTWSDNDVVYCTDGSGVCRGWLAESVKLRDRWNENDVDKSASMAVSGMLNGSMLLGDTDAIIATKSTHDMGDIQIWTNNARVA